jgi:hypothetical protein
MYQRRDCPDIGGSPGNMSTAGIRCGAMIAALLVLATSASGHTRQAQRQTDEYTMLSDREYIKSRWGGAA